MALTNVAIKSAKPGAKPFKLAHSEGLHLLVQPSGARYWLGQMASKRGHSFHGRVPASSG
jgi:hypothetical protein